MKKEPRPRARPARPQSSGRRPHTSHLLWIIPVLIVLGFGIVIGVFADNEMRSSKLQAEWLSTYGKRIHFAMRPGINDGLRFPAEGPYNRRLGYSDIPSFEKALAAAHFTVAAQARASPAYNQFIAYGLYPVYRAKTVTGLTLYDHDGKLIYAASYPTRVFPDFRAIPPLLVDTLLYVEDRDLLKPGPATRNPVVEWKRFLYAAAGHILQKFGLPVDAGGGSTLATQIEKFRYAPGGETRGVLDKLRQIASASLRVYLGGPDTSAARKHIVLDYLNSTPLGARPGFGEINSIGDGLWAWFGIDLPYAETALNLPDTDTDSLRVKAPVYRAALGLILAQRRPSYYLAADRAALDDLTDATLDRLAKAGVISDALRDAAKQASFKFLPTAPPLPQPPFIERKATDALRNHLLGMLGLHNLYELDRIDLAARAALDQTAQQKTVDFLKRMDNRGFLQAHGFYGFRLLKPNDDAAKVKWSVILYQRTPGGDEVRVQSDNVDEPFDMNEDMKLDLGSTAKLRTLVTYLQIMAGLYHRYADLAPAELAGLAKDAPDTLTQWATAWLAAHKGATLGAMLDASMDRTYSANPNEAFFTGGGIHHFVNFEHREDGQRYDLRNAFANSVNLVFIRLMRDIVDYMIAQGPDGKQKLLDDADLPTRQTYLQRFAEREGAEFLNHFVNQYQNLTPGQVLDKLLSHGRASPAARTVEFRAVRPKASYGDYAAFMAAHGGADPSRLHELYADYPPGRYDLSDSAYIAGLNPLELWLAGYLQENPHATRSAILAVSRPVRLESYAWLFRPGIKQAQDQRIGIMLEVDAFRRIHIMWAQLGYPFDYLVPSLATAIGCSADRPDALAALVGLILNHGVKLPAIRFESLQFAAGTPYQTLLTRDGPGAPQRLLEPALARVVRQALLGPVQDGTATGVKGVYRDASGAPLPVGGKTGTGDHRYDEFGAGGRLISSRAISRTGTFVFYLGDRFFGTITAHVAGEAAGNYTFSSAIAVHMLKELAPIFEPLIDGPPMTARNNVPGAVPP
ncbi:MAG TPA: transglycosylase domain-containing protein [Alphaproteobacteria bacterium]|nr:transglycosylase domain-containing protein [Alphaproteobacteria bacterium]